MNIYKMLWSRIGGRPFTYAIRDFWHKYEWFWIAGLMLAGGAVVHYWDFITLLKALGIFTVGYVAGHLFWGRQYIPNQQGK